MLWRRCYAKDFAVGDISGKGHVLALMAGRSAVVVALYHFRTAEIMGDSRGGSVHDQSSAPSVPVVLFFIFFVLFAVPFIYALKNTKVSKCDHN